MTEQPTNTSHHSSRLGIRIRQKKLNKSLTAQSDLLHQLDPDEYDMAAIQEPYLDLSHKSWTTQNWYTVYLKEHYVKPKKTQSLILINKRIPSNTGHRLT